MAEAAITNTETIVDTAVGCPYGMAAEQAISANDSLIAETAVVTIKELGEERFTAQLITATEADSVAEDLAAGILGCETCNGNPHSVDLKDKVCDFAVQTCMGITFVPKDIKEIIESRDTYGR